jgi:hypothetical protein
MAIGDTLTQAFLDEIRKRKERMYLVVYEGTNADNTVHPTEPDLFICRHRSAVMHEELQTVRYSTSMRLEDVKNQLRRGRTTMYDPIVVEIWQFIIVDREIGSPFQPMDIVQDTLLMLTGDPSPRQVAKRVIRKIISRLYRRSSWTRSLSKALLMCVTQQHSTCSTKATDTDALAQTTG